MLFLEKHLYLLAGALSGKLSLKVKITVTCASYGKRHKLAHYKFSTPDWL